MDVPQAVKCVFYGIATLKMMRSVHEKGKQLEFAAITSILHEQQRLLSFYQGTIAHTDLFDENWLQTLFDLGQIHQVNSF